MKKLLITAAIIATATTANASKLDDVLNYTGNNVTATFILDTCSLLKNKYVSESDHSKLQQIAIEREICGYYKKSKSTQPVVDEEPKGDVVGLCKEYYAIGENIMQKRQAGISQSAMMEMTQPENGDSNETKLAKTVIREAVQYAYSQPRWHTRESQRRAVQDFAIEFEQECWDAFG